MKFAEDLTAHLTPEWRVQYINYEALKECLYKALEDFEEFRNSSPDAIGNFLDSCDLMFFKFAENELGKVNNFFAEKLAEAKRKFTTLLDEQEMYSIAAVQRPPSLWTSNPLLSMGSRRWQQPESGVSHDGRVSVAHSQRDLHSSPDTKNHHTSEIHASRYSETKTKRRVKILPAPLRRKKSSQMEQEKKTVKKLHELKLAFSEFYLSLVLLQNYQSLNLTGFRKILKKHDKLFQRTNGLTWHKESVCPSSFNTNQEVDNLITEVENIYTQTLEHGDRPKAMKRLRVPPLSDEHRPWPVFRFGLFAGIFIMEVIVICLTVAFGRSSCCYWPALRIFRSTFLLIFFLTLIGVNTYGWRSSGVNHVLIFEIDPRWHLSHFEILELAFFFAILWGAAVIAYLYSSAFDVPSYVFPFLLVLVMVLYLVQPLAKSHRRARWWLLRVLWRICRAPFVHVEFADFWLADQLNSLSFLLPDIAFFICFYSSLIDWRTFTVKPSFGCENGTLHAGCTLDYLDRDADFNYLFSAFVVPKTSCDELPFFITPILYTLPAWFRFAQCIRRFKDMDPKQPLPHLVNAGKYSTTFFVSIFAAWTGTNSSSYIFAMLVLASAVSSCYTYSWDIFMDWGLLDKSSKENIGLRDELVYRFKAYYYFGILEDAVIRLAWIANLTISRMEIAHIEFARTVIAVAEVTRRFIWNFFRLENEHLNNCGQFRAVRDICIAPIRKESRPTAESVASVGHIMVATSLQNHRKKVTQFSGSHNDDDQSPSHNSETDSCQDTGKDGSNSGNTGNYLVCDFAAPLVEQVGDEDDKDETGSPESIWRRMRHPWVRLVARHRASHPHTPEVDLFSHRKESPVYVLRSSELPKVNIEWPSECLSPELVADPNLTAEQLVSDEAVSDNEDEYDIEHGEPKRSIRYRRWKAVVSARAEGLRGLRRSTRGNMAATSFVIQEANEQTGLGKSISRRELRKHNLKVENLRNEDTNQHILPDIFNTEEYAESPQTTILPARTQYLATQLRNCLRKHAEEEALRNSSTNADFIDNLSRSLAGTAETVVPDEQERPNSAVRSFHRSITLPCLNVLEQEVEASQLGSSTEDIQLSYSLPSQLNYLPHKISVEVLSPIEETSSWTEPRTTTSSVASIHDGELAHSPLATIPYREHESEANEAGIWSYSVVQPSSHRIFTVTRTENTAPTPPSPR